MNLLRQIVLLGPLVLIVVAISLTGDRRSADAEQYTTFKIIMGMATTQAWAYPHAMTCGGTYSAYWHCDEGGFPNNVALDIHDYFGNDLRDTYWQSHASASTGYAYAETSNHDDLSTNCHGVNVHLWIPYPESTYGTWIGYENYVHIDNSISFGSYWYTNTFGWTIVKLGTVTNTNYCPGYWDGAHLHQSGGSGPISTNWTMNDDDGSHFGLDIITTGETTNNWLHWVYY